MPKPVVTKLSTLDHVCEMIQQTDQVGIVLWKELESKLEAKDVLPNINRAHAAKRTGKCRF